MKICLANESDYNAYEESIEEVHDYNDESMDTTTYYPLVSAETTDQREMESSIAPIITTTTVQKVMTTMPPPPVAHSPMMNKTDRSFVVNADGMITELTPSRTESTPTTVKVDKIMHQTPSTTTQKSNGFRSFINLKFFILFNFIFYFI